MTKLTVRQVAALKRNAQNAYPLVKKAQSLNEKISELEKEAESLITQINALDAGSRILTGGLNAFDCIKREVVDTGKVDKNGSPVKITKFEVNPKTLQLNEDGTYTVIYPSVPQPDSVNCNDGAMNTEYVANINTMEE